MNDNIVTGRGGDFFRKVEDRHGPEVADAVRLASLPVDERLRVLRHRVCEIDRRLDELRDGDA